jgi:alanyl-tRNA synthetase
VNSDGIRTAFLSFFEERGHKIVPSSSLVPHDDPTLLLTSAGMVQFKPYFLGETVPPGPRLASCQKCFRTTDIESVGDTTHLTFFEMLGNFSVGDYFKAEAIGWAWEFVTRRLRLHPERLWTTIFLDDDESFKIWRKIGIPELRIIRLGEKDNFWGPAGSSGPCGPCSEIHYDLGEGVGCGRDSCTPGCDCGRFSEIWNLVFTQYNQDKVGNRTPLTKPNIDTGMGLERTAVARQGKTSIYETDLFTPVIERISELVDRKYGSDSSADYAMRIIAEHSRGIAFLIADGVTPSNEGRGYVLRRLLRRAALFGKRLGLDKPFLVETARVTTERMEHIYPELLQRQDFINKMIELEEARFSETLSTGLELLDEIMERTSKRREIPGAQAFKLYDTYGFPVELTSEIAAGSSFTVDMEGFEREMAEQRERAKASHKFIAAIAKNAVTNNVPHNLQDTHFVGYHNLSYESTILDFLVNNTLPQIIKEGQQASIILKDTPFYGEMGGQVGDTGEIYSPSGRFTVTNAIRLPEGVILHQGHVTEGYLSIGDRVEAVVNAERRLDIARNHTATHLLQLALRQVLGEHVQQRGSLVAPDRLRFDFSHLTAMTREEILEVQRIVNEKIRQDLKVYDEETPYQEAIGEGAIALFDEKYGDRVRVLKIGKPFISAELCGGTHINSSGEIGYFYIIGESSIGTGLRRIEAVTGRGAEVFIDKYFSDFQKTAEYLDTAMDNILGKVSSLVTQLNWERKQVRILESALTKSRAEDLLNQVEIVNGVTVLAAKVPSSRMEVLREISDRLRERLKSAVVVLGTIYENKPAFIAAVTPDLVAKGYSASEIVKQIARITDGGGGGKATLAQAGGKDINKLDEALRLVSNLV